MEVVSATFRDSFHLSFTIHKSRNTKTYYGCGCWVAENIKSDSGEEIHHSSLGEVSMQRFDLSTKRYLLDK